MTSSSPIKYSSHLDSYLPTFEMNNSEMDTSSEPNTDNIKMNIEGNVKSSGKTLDEGSQSELTVIEKEPQTINLCLISFNQVK